MADEVFLALCASLQSQGMRPDDAMREARRRLGLDRRPSSPLSFVQRFIVGRIWKKVRESMTKETFNRWAPVIGGLVVVASSLLRANGRADIASVLDTVGAVGGVTALPDVPWAEIGKNTAVIFSASAFLYGAVRKVWMSLRLR